MPSALGFPFLFYRFPSVCPILLTFRDLGRFGPTAIALLREVPPIRGWGKGGVGGVREGTKRGLRAPAGFHPRSCGVRGLQTASRT